MWHLDLRWLALIKHSHNLVVAVAVAVAKAETPRPRHRKSLVCSSIQLAS